MNELLKLIQPNEFIRRDELIYLYVTAMDTNDFEIAFAVLEAATQDAVLDCLINDINRDYEREMQLEPFAEDAAVVSKLIREHLPSAFDSDELQPRPVTFADVARQLEARGKVASQDTAANLQLLDEESPLPKHLNLPEIRRILGELKIKASEKFFRLVHETAILLEMRKGHQLGLHAAREKRIRKQTGKNAEQKTESQLEAEFNKEFDGQDDRNND